MNNLTVSMVRKKSNPYEAYNRLSVDIGWEISIINGGRSFFVCASECNVSVDGIDDYFSRNDPFYVGRAEALALTLDAGPVVFSGWVNQSGASEHE